MWDPSCLNETNLNLESSQVYTYCGNCRGIRELIDKHTSLKRSYDSCLKLNELLVEKINMLERKSTAQNYFNKAPVLPPWNETKERARFQKFMTDISSLDPNKGERSKQLKYRPHILKSTSTSDDSEIDETE